MSDGTGRVVDPAGDGAAENPAAPGGAQRPVGAAPGSAPTPSGARKLAGLGGALAAVYLVLAGVNGLPPFGPTSTPQPSPPPGASHFRVTAADRALRRLIPPGIQSAGQCVYHQPAFAARAQVDCAGVAGTPETHLDYYLFGGSAALNNAYSDVLTRDAGAAEGSGDCGSFQTFSPCETQYGPGSATAGRIVEYGYRRRPAIAFTVDKDLLLVDAQGANGGRLVAWWARLPPPWLSARR